MCLYAIFVSCHPTAAQNTARAMSPNVLRFYACHNPHICAKIIQPNYFVLNSTKKINSGNTQQSSGCVSGCANLPIMLEHLV